MKIAVIGASGNAGSRITRRTPPTTAIPSPPLPATRRRSRHFPPVTAEKGDVFDKDGLIRASWAMTQFISVISWPAIRMAGRGPAGLKRRPYLLVGGAGSLEIAPGNPSVDTPHFLKSKGGGAEGRRLPGHAADGRDLLDSTFLSPSALFVAGERTGKYRIGTDQLLTAADGKSCRFPSRISQLRSPTRSRRPAHVRQRFTVGY